MQIAVEVLIGIALLFAGKRLFWLLVGAVGFWLGITLAGNFLPDSSEATQLLIALVAGIAGAVLAVFLQRLAIVIVGFLGGAFLLANLIQLFSESSLVYWGGFIIGGILGAALVALLFDLALILLSAGIGAQFLLNAVELPSAQEAIIFIVLFAVGAAAQARLFREDRRARD